MGLFDFLKSLLSGGSGRFAESNKVWLSTAAKVQGIAADVARTRDAGEPCLVAAHFPNTFRGLRDLLDGLNVEFVVAQERLDVRQVADLLLDAGPAVVLALSRDLPAAAEAGETWDDAAPSARIIAVEHYPLAAGDDRLRALAGALPGRGRLQIHAALDDRLLRIFAGEQVGTLLRQLGMKESEAIESPMVTRRIISAQRKIAARATGDEPAESAEEWFRTNCPGLL